MKKISVIIPCYNAVASIDRCLDSLVNQTIGIENMEIVLVNDASTDRTLEKLCEWEQTYPDSIMVINCEENGKQGQARNIGLQYASGQYIGFADDDDLLESDMYEVLYRAALDNQCDMAVCQSVKHTIEEQVQIPDCEKKEEIIIPSSIGERQKFLKRDINIAIWNKIYRRELLLNNHISFLPGYIYDDIYFSALVKQYCTRVYITNQILYHHIISETSVSYGAKSKIDRIGFLEVHIALIEELRNRGFYDIFSDWYEQEFFIDYISFIVNFEKTFGKMEPELEKLIQENVVALFPDYKEIPVVQKIISGGNQVYREILQKLDSKSD